ncbi:MAG: caspase family protein [Treponema sp.]|jgi:hypothetical protein|nr:caspase family protein [Treponema sp.]
MRIKRLIIVPVLLLCMFSANAQQNTPPKYALVIGNGAYSGISRLANPVNDAEDMAAALSRLGFTVDKLLNGSLEQMEAAVMRLRNRLSNTPDGYGFFFYAGHGVQSNGENYLIPVNANIPAEAYLRNRAVSLQDVLDILHEAGNTLNIVVLDACRNNPFGWSRGGGRGLEIVRDQPRGSIIVYATGAGKVASDNPEGRNGLFTGKLLANLETPGLEVYEVFHRTGFDVTENNKDQTPAIYSQFFGTAYLGAPSSALARLDFGSRPAAPVPVRQPLDPDDAKLWTLGASFGMTLAPMYIGTVYGTIAPFKYSLLEIGMDVGGGGEIGYKKQFSLYPYARYSLFMPFAKTNNSRSSGGFYAGLGMGVMFSTYTYSASYYGLDTSDVYYDFDTSDDYYIENDGKVSKNAVAFDATVGVIFKGFTLSYSLRTDFAVVSNKIAAGYSFRF